jgi:hypothetical protein
MRDRLLRTVQYLQMAVGHTSSVVIQTGRMGNGTSHYYFRIVMKILQLALLLVNRFATVNFPQNNCCCITVWFFFYKKP